MQSLSQTIAEAFVADEVCPLCLDRYAVVDECTCVVCDAASCPGCAEMLDPQGTMRCYACAPVASHEQSGVRATVLPFDLAQPSLSPERKVGGSRLRSVYRSLSGLYSSGLRSLKKPIEALSLRMLAKSKSAVMTPSSDRSSSLSLSPR
jgi:hypothetical protein